MTMVMKMGRGNLETEGERWGEKQSKMEITTMCYIHSPTPHSEYKLHELQTRTNKTKLKKNEFAFYGKKY